jgi:hypothetical protein
MLSLKDGMMKQEQYQDLPREAENRALVQQALMERKRRRPLAGRMLAAWVRHLIDLGCYLLERCASALKVPVQTPCQDAGTNQPRTLRGVEPSDPKSDSWFPPHPVSLVLSLA